MNAERGIRVVNCDVCIYTGRIKELRLKDGEESCSGDAEGHDEEVEEADCPTQAPAAAVPWIFSADQDAVVVERRRSLGCLFPEMAKWEETRMEVMGLEGDSGASTATLAAASPEQATMPAPPLATGDDGDPNLLQFYYIIYELIVSGNLGNCGKMLSSYPSMIPLSATLFVPANSSFSSGVAATNLPLTDPILVSRHIVPQSLSFSDLTLFPIGSKLPTLLVDSPIVITNNSRSNFTLNGLSLILPDLLSTATVSVHGITDILNFTTHGEADLSTSISPKPEKQEGSPALPPNMPDGQIRTREPSPPPTTIDENALQASRSGALSTAILVVFCLVIGLIKTVGI
ncbi:hypothetical protein SAY86_006857 [Trapa natans]|uniref:FAS1 domain-containing protein n=1 Tax=Trapa natans TaxID=22666 RepID=A0AAN7QTM5_TRANT|nr:hypothetical protein SAY86_006857 [Trapa natans]